jgi:hypothetical protein
LCGYNTCIEALDFHHINPHEKDMVLHKKDLSIVVKAELDKCLVLCSNCHREVHAGYRTIEQKKQYKKQIKEKRKRKELLIGVPHSSVTPTRPTKLRLVLTCPAPTVLSSGIAGITVGDTV